MKTNFRIVCLKNDESRKYRDDRIASSNVIVGPVERKDKKISDSRIPNLVHLSARLQDDSREEKRSDFQKYHNQTNQSQEQNSVSNVNFEDLSLNKAEEARRLRQLQIERFFEEKRNTVQKEKNTMKNLLGSINFTSNKHKEKKVSRLIKEACASQRGHRKFKSSDKSVLAQNKIQLQEDFQNFLTNKQKANSPPSQDLQDFKLKRLSKVNPEQEVIQSARPPQIQPLNLFHFLHKKQAMESPKPKQKSRNRSSSHVKASSSHWNGRVDKKIFNFQSSLKTEQQQFEWSKLKDQSPNPRNFTFKTLDL